MLTLGDTVMLPKPGQEKEHLWALITAADPESGDAIMVNLTTQRPHSDTTTIIQPGERPFVDRPTVVFCADARIVNVNTLEEALRHGVCRQNAPLSASVSVHVIPRTTAVASQSLTGLNLPEALSDVSCTSNRFRRFSFCMLEENDKEVA
jgi:hypothetical protein